MFLGLLGEGVCPDYGAAVRPLPSRQPRVVNLYRNIRPRYLSEGHAKENIAVKVQE